MFELSFITVYWDNPIFPAHLCIPDFSCCKPRIPEPPKSTSLWPWPPPWDFSLGKQFCLPRTCCAYLASPVSIWYFQATSGNTCLGHSTLYPSFQGFGLVVSQCQLNYSVWPVPKNSHQPLRQRPGTQSTGLAEPIPEPLATLALPMLLGWVLKGHYQRIFSQLPCPASLAQRFCRRLTLSSGSFGTPLKSVSSSGTPQTARAPGTAEKTTVLAPFLLPFFRCPDKAFKSACPLFLLWVSNQPEPTASLDGPTERKKKFWAPPFFFNRAWKASPGSQALKRHSHSVSTAYLGSP